MRTFLNSWILLVALLAFWGQTSAFSETLSPPKKVVTSAPSKKINRRPKSLSNAYSGPSREMLTLGINYIFPTLQFQHSVSPKITVGLTSLLLHALSTTDSSLKGYGFTLGANYYFTGPYQGAWVELAPGINFLRTEVTGASTQETTFSIRANLGWRWAWPSGMNLGMAFGAHAFLFSSELKAQTGVNTVVPSLVVDFGYSF